MTGRAALFLDRDGVLNEDLGYVNRWEDFRWIPGARRLIKRFNDAGWLVIVLTNQAGVARGYYDEAAVAKLHSEVNGDLAGVGARIDAFYYCPYHEDAKIERYRIADHPDRKPNPGMILRAAEDWKIDLARSLMIGDKPSDMEAARRAGVEALLFSGGDLEAFIDMHRAGFLRA
ncbi:MAG: HAD family hydrolase [Alphaproteobacteria bacterium]